MNRSLLLQASFGTLLVCVLLRAMVTFEPLPGWDGNPLGTLSAITGLGPAGFLLLDTMTVLAGALLCLFAGRRLGWAALLAFFGACLVLVRTMLLDRNDAEPLATAGAWASGAIALGAASVVSTRPSLRRAATALLLGFLCVLLANGAGQLLIEHPAVVASFESDPEAALATRGYRPGSAAALQFERRLRQPDITGWFGLSNVLAAFLAAGAVAGLMTLWQSRRMTSTWSWRAVLALTALCWVGVAATGSKAGLVIAGAGSGAAIFAQLLTGRRAVAAGLGLWLLPVAAISARAALLPPEGELSLLFRWFYLESAWDIAASNLPWGTGIDGFRAAYAIAKPPIAPETVTSSHNAISDWAAMLGAFGVLLIGTVLVAVWQSSFELGQRRVAPALATPTRATVLGMVVVLSVPVAISAMMEAEAALLELSLLRLLGLASAALVAACVWRLRPSKAVPAASAVVLLTHAQLDMMLYHPGSAPLALFAIGLALPPGRLGGRWRWAWLVPVACSIALGLLCVRAWQWEAPLRQAFAAAQPIAAASERANSGSRSDQLALGSLIEKNTPEIRRGAHRRRRGDAR